MKTRKIGRPKIKGERKQSFSISLLASEQKEIIKKYGTLTQAIKTLLYESWNL